MKGRSKMNRGRSLALLLVATAVLGTMSGCQKTDDGAKEETKNQDMAGSEANVSDLGTVIVGMDGAHAPYCSLNEDTNELEGFEVDMMNEVSQRTGLEMEIEVASWKVFLECWTVDS